jgi:hypothetical protein
VLSIHVSDHDRESLNLGPDERERELFAQAIARSYRHLTPLEETLAGSLIEVSLVDEQKVHLPDGEVDKPALSKLCDAVLEEFAASPWYQANVPGGRPIRFERAMCKTFLAYLITQKKPAK